MKMIRIIYLLIIAITLIKADEHKTIDFPFTNLSQVFKAEDEMFFTVNVPKKPTQRYVWIHTQTNSMGNPLANVEISFSEKDREPNRDNAEFFFALNGGTEVDLFVPKTNFTKNQVYIGVKCALSLSCEFNMTVNESSHIVVHRDNKYNHLTSPEELGMGNDFYKIQRKNETGGDQKAVMTISVSGSIFRENIFASLKYYEYEGATPKEIQLTQFREGVIATFKETDYPVSEENLERAYYEIEVSPAPGDEIRIDTKSTVPGDLKQQNIIIPNNHGMLSVLNENLPEECYNIEPYVPPGYTQMMYIHLLVYTGNATFFRIDQETGKRIPGTEVEVVDEAIFNLTWDKELESHICVAKPQSDLNTTYYLQVLDYENRAKPNIYEGQYLGYSYHRLLPNRTNTFFTFRGYGNITAELNLMMRSIKGYAVMYWVQCKTFPNCTYGSKAELDEQIRRDFVKGREMHSVNEFYSHKVHIEGKYVTPFGTNQDVLVVFCEDETENCEFDTTFYTDNNFMHLSHNTPFYQYVMAHKSENIYLSTVNNFQRIIISLTQFNGDLVFDLPIDSEYYDVLQFHAAANKRIYELRHKRDENGNIIQRNDMGRGILVNLKAGNFSTYYILEFRQIYRHFTEDDEPTMTGLADVEIVKGGVGRSRRFYLKHTRKEKKFNFMVTFTSLNCKVDITRGDEEKKHIKGITEYFAEDIITKDELYYYQELFMYNVTIKEMDNSLLFNDQICMIQISGLEMDNNYNETTNFKERGITITENYDNQIILNKDFKRIKFSYPHTAHIGPVVIKSIIETDAVVTLNIYYGTDKDISETYILSRAKTIFLTQERIGEKCKDSYGRFDFCVINMIIQPMYPQSIEGSNTINMKLSIRSIDTNPSFVSKSILLQDYIIEGDTQYYFTEVSKGEEGEVFVNFNRGSGSVYGRLVDRMTADSVVEQPSWFGKYSLPTIYNNDLFTDVFNLRTKYTKSMTDSQCPHGCYLIIGVDSNTTEIDMSTASKVNDISVVFHELSSKDGKIKYTTIPVNDYVIGSIVKSSDGDGESSLDLDYFQYYYFKVDVDAEDLFIEFFSEVCELEVKVDNLVFNYKSSGARSIYKISTYDFPYTKNINTLKDKEFYIKVSALDFSGSYTARFIFRLRTPKQGYKELISVDTDQVSLCKIEDSRDMCFFIVELDNLDKDYVLAFANMEEQGLSDLVIYTRQVDALDIDLWDKTKYNNALPKDTEGGYDYSSKNQTYKDYLEIPIKKKDEYNTFYYLIIGVKSEKIGLINFSINFDRYTGIYKANPSLNQLHFLRAGENVTLAIPSDGFYSLKIVSIFGEAEMNYLDEPEKSYVLHGDRDVVELAMQFKDNYNIKPLDNKDFAFIVSIDQRVTDENYDEVPYGISTQIVIDSLPDEEFPLRFYCRIPEEFRKVPFSFSLQLYELIPSETQNDVKDPLKMERKKIEFDREFFEMQGIIISEEVAIGKKKNKKINPDMTRAEHGVWDQVLDAGQVHFSIADMEVVQDDVKYGYIEVKKLGRQGSKKYDRVTVEVLVLPVTGEKQSFNVPYNQYVYGYIENAGDVLRYQLRRQNSKHKFFKIQFGKNGANVNYNISKFSSASGDNTTFINSVYKGGRGVVDIEADEDLILQVYLKDKSQFFAGLCNFGFKYETAEKLEDITVYDVSDLNVKYNFNEKDKTIDIDFSPVKKKTGSSEIISTATYYVKLVPRSSIDTGEIINSIAFDWTPYMQRVFIFDADKEYATEEKLSLQVQHRDFENDFTVSIVASVFTGYSKDIIAYNLFSYQASEASSGSTWIIVILIILAIILLGGVVFVYLYMHGKNEDLRKKVESTSFAGNGDSNELLVGKKADN